MNSGESCSGLSGEPNRLEKRMREDERDRADHEDSMGRGGKCDERSALVWFGKLSARC